jgi:CDP-paratose 2-epimerase
VVSLLDLLEHIAALQGTRPAVRFEEWRTGDQRYYVSDTRRFQNATGWRARVGLKEGLDCLYRWLLHARGLALEAPGGAEAVLEHPNDERLTSAGGGR